jgi:hypothetical protein
MDKEWNRRRGETVRREPWSNKQKLGGHFNFLSVFQEIPNPSAMVKDSCLILFCSVMALPVIAQTNDPAPVETNSTVSRAPAAAAAVPATPAPAAAPVAGPTTKTLAVTGWCAIGNKTFVPKEEGGKILFTEPDFGKKGKCLAAYFDKTDLADGQTLKFKANLRFTGVSSTGNFRYGIFKKRSKDHSRGWLGYCAYAGFDINFPKGNLIARLPENDGAFDGVRDGEDRPTALVIGVTSAGPKALKDGVYVMEMAIHRVGANLECTASMAPQGQSGTPAVKYSGKDERPATMSFDALGFVTHQVLSADSLEFSEVSVTLETP